MRPLPKSPAVEVSAERAASWSEEVEIVLITQLFGGGARPRQLDERSWLRPAAFKSVLRFWWRAGYAHRFLSLPALRAEEGRLFGASARFGKEGQVLGGPGLLEVEVEKAVPANLSKAPFEPGDGDALNISYFGARQKDEQPALLGQAGQGGKALLRIQAHTPVSAEDRAQLLGALRLWLVLGGVGSRTRRGAGAVAPVKEARARALEVPGSEAELHTFLRSCLRPDEGAHTHEGLWHLAASRAVFVGRAHREAVDAQKRLLEVLRDFRQKRKHPTSWRGPAGWGRSQWPEADAIRLRAGVPAGWKHQPNATHAERFPRAALGLPIVMHFKDAPPHGQDPGDFTISAARPERDGWSRVNRFASPLFLRPVQVWENGEKRFVPVAWIGPFTLPPDFRPLAEPKADGAPPLSPEPAQVAEAFDLATAAATLYADLDTAFTHHGFSRLS